MTSVEILEVAPRDGFQAVKPFIPTQAKVKLIEELAACGFKRMEIGSFVSPKALPQMADTPDILKRARLPEDLRVMALVPNAKGLQLALERRRQGDQLGHLRLGEPQPLQRQPQRRRELQGFRRGLGQVWAGTSRSCALASRRASIALGKGAFREDDVIRAVERVIAAAPDVEIGICDTTGRAAPDHVGSLLSRIMPRYASDRVTFAYHGHDTYGLGVANAIEAYRQGVRVIDGAAGGLGGCPFAPGAAGNTASEDLVFAFEHMGVKTGIDFKRLLVAADHVAEVEPSQAGGKLRTVPRKRALSGFGHATQGFRREGAA